MTLSEYVKSFPRNQRNAIRQLIAKHLGISEVYVRSMCNDNKRIPPKYALRLETITDGRVTRHITAPDFYPLENAASISSANGED